MGIYWFCDLVISCSFIMLVLLIPPWLLRWHTCGDHFLETMLILMLKRIPVPMDISVMKLNAVRHFGSYGCGCILQLLMKDSMFWVLPVRSWYLWTKCSLIISLSNFYFILFFYLIWVLLVVEICIFSCWLHNLFPPDSIFHHWVLSFSNFDFLASIAWQPHIMQLFDFSPLL